MASLPKLIEEDIEALDQVLRAFLNRSDATTALIVDKGGFLITHQGEAGRFDLTTISALAAGSYLASQTIAGLIHEQTFSNVYQQGENFSLLATNVDEQCLLLVIFPAQIGVGVVKLFATRIRERLARQLRCAHERDPQAGLDLSELNLPDTSTVFKSKA